jgi:hypothetical protein
MARTSTGRNQGRKTKTATKRTGPTRRTSARPARGGAKSRRTTTSPRGHGRRNPLRERTVRELREQAREMKIEGRSRMTKDQLIRAINRQGR